MIHSFFVNSKPCNNKPVSGQSMSINFCRTLKRFYVHELQVHTTRLSSTLCPVFFMFIKNK